MARLSQSPSGCMRLQRQSAHRLAKGRMMKLFWSTRSPFVRKVMIVVYELGIEDQVETIRTIVHPARPNAEVTAFHPLGKIPSLILDDGRVLYDSRVICEYLDAQYGTGSLLPAAGPARWRILTRHAMIDAMLETALLWLLERARPAEQRQDELIDASRTRILAGLDALEGDGDFHAETPLTLAHVAAASALGYLDFRFGELGWRDDRPRLDRWFARMSARPSVVNTAFADIY